MDPSNLSSPREYTRWKTEWPGKTEFRLESPSHTPSLLQAPSQVMWKVLSGATRSKQYRGWGCWKQDSYSLHSQLRSHPFARDICGFSLLLCAHHRLRLLMESWVQFLSLKEFPTWFPVFFKARSTKMDTTSVPPEFLTTNTLRSCCLSLFPPWGFWQWISLFIDTSALCNVKFAGNTAEK